MGFRVGRKQTLPFAILKPVASPPQMEHVHVCLGADDLREFFAGHNYAGDYMAFDIETKGNQVFNPESRVVGFALADARGAGYWTAEHWPVLLECLLIYTPRLVAHNVFFDGAYVMRDGNGLWPSWAYCTYGLYKQLATEGWLGQRWGLKDAQKQLLKWEETNETELLEWLVNAGYYKSTRKSIDEVKEKGDWFLTPDGVYAKADKGEMWRAPAEILGKYCALDAHATHLLLTKVLLPGLQKFDVLNDFHRDVFLPNVRILIEQELSGILVDVAGLHKHAASLHAGVGKTTDEFFAHPEVAPHVEAYNQVIVDAHMQKEPAPHNKGREAAEPPKYKKDGSITKRWVQWNEALSKPQPKAKRWLQWEEKRQALASTNHFNLGSGPQLAELFYRRLGKPVLLTTESGAPAVDGKAMGQWGEPGKLLKTRSKYEKELGYVQAVIDYQREGLVHPQFRVPGTLTGRLSGSGGLNMQQMPKSKEFLSLFKARKGYVWVDFDYVALEPSVLTELSRDPNMLKVYGPNAPQHQDIYIFVGSSVPGIKETFTACGYNPDAPTKESIERIKKEHKVLRNICKVLTLSAQYGAGPRTIHETLKLQGVHKELEEVRAIHAAYWQLFAGIKEYEKFLLGCWQRNGGWVLNGVGRPLSVHRDLTKDIVNRVVQSCGHDIHMIGLSILEPLLAKAFGKDFRWIIADFHDEAIIEVPEGGEQVAIECFRSMEAQLNELLKPYVPIKIDPAVGKNLAKFKVSE